MILNLLGWLLVVSAAALILLGLRDSAATAQSLGKSLSTSAVPAGVLLTLGGLLLSRAREAADTQEKRSLFYLESSVAAYQEAQKLLADDNNDRATWIAAARALKHGQELSKGVTLDAHLRVLELHHLKYRGLFDDILRGKPATFFYGAQDLSIAIDTAAAASTASEERAGRTVTSTVKQLSEASLHAVWEAAQFPPDYKDPLDAKFSEKEQGRLMVLFPGLHEYLEHTKHYASASGRLFPRKEGETR